MSGELIKNRIKVKLERLQPYVDNLEKMSHDEVLQVFATIDGMYDSLCFINDTALDSGIAKFDGKLKELDEKLDDANKAVLDVFKKKIELYQKAYKTLMSEL